MINFKSLRIKPRTTVTITEKSGEKNTLTFKSFEFILHRNTQPSTPLKEGISIFYVFTGGDKHPISYVIDGVDINIVTTDRHREVREVYYSKDVSCVLAKEGTLVCSTDNIKKEL
jgi:hypothetical protein